MKTGVAIIGAGPAGLTAGYLLAKNDVDVTVLELDPVYVGGISRTARYKGFHFDIGGHRFFSKSKAVDDFWNEILPDDMLNRPRSSRIFYGGKFFAYPLKPFEALMKLGVVTSDPLRFLLVARAPFPGGESAELSGLGDEPIRPPALQHLLQELHRKGLGHELPRDLGRLGGAADQRLVVRQRDQERAPAAAPAARQEQGDQDADQFVPLSAKRPGHDVGSVRGKNAGAGRRACRWAAA